MEYIGPILNGAGVFILSLIGLYNLWTAKGRAEKIATLEANTNSIKDALIRVTGEAEHAKGVIQGRAETIVP